MAWTWILCYPIGFRKGIFVYIVLSLSFLSKTVILLLLLQTKRFATHPKTCCHLLLLLLPPAFICNFGHLATLLLENKFFGQCWNHFCFFFVFNSLKKGAESTAAAAAAAVATKVSNGATPNKKRSRDPTADEVLMVHDMMQNSGCL